MHILDMCPACGVSQLKCTSILLNRQSRFVPRMWSCLAGFIEPGESLEEAVRRETWEETGIEVGEVIYHSSQPWPIGLGHVSCQLMVGFFAYAKTLEINVDKEELEDAQWHIREDVSKALIFAEYKKTQLTAAAKVEQMCKGVEKGQNLSADFNVESGELACGVGQDIRQQDNSTYKNKYAEWIDRFVSDYEMSERISLQYY